jgi:anaphase-promoting complex subunit 6
MATDLLNRALEDQGDIGNMTLDKTVEDANMFKGYKNIPALEDGIDAKLKEIQQNRVAGRGGRRGRRHVSVDESGYGDSMIVDSDE